MRARLASGDLTPGFGMPPGAVGMVSSFEFAIRFIDWADALGAALTPERIVERWECSRATSYRWWRAYQAARGIA